jgi:hypothetical protein
MITDRDMKTEIRHTLNDLVLDLDTITQAVYYEDWCPECQEELSAIRVKALGLDSDGTQYN